MLVEGVEPFLNGVDVIVNATGGLSTLEETLGHSLVFDIKVQDFSAGSDLLFEFLSLEYKVETLEQQFQNELLVPKSLT